MNVPFSPLQYRAEDRVLLDVPELSRHARVSLAFIRLCLARGCPAIEGRLSQAMLLEWLFQNYESVRTGAGLRTLAAVEGLPAEIMLKLRVANGLLTLLEFSEMKSSNPREKQRLSHIRRMLELSLDR